MAWWKPSGRKERIRLMEEEARQNAELARQEAERQSQRQREEIELAQAAKDREAQKKIFEEIVQVQRADQKAVTARARTAQLDGLTGFRSLLSGRKGGAGFGPRSFLG